MAYGDITKSIIDTLEIESGQGLVPSVVSVSRGVIAVAYQDGPADGWIKTFSCDSDGNFSGIISTLEFDTDEGRSPYLMHINGTTYAVVYRGPDGDGFIRTLTIQNDGTIDGLIDGWEFDNQIGHEAKLIHVSGTVYAVFYLGWSAGNKYALKTFNIANNGVITKSFIDSLFRNIIVEFTTILRGNGNYFVLGYEDAVVGALYIDTVEIDNDGNIAASVTDTYMVDGSARDMDVTELASGYFLAQYADSPGTNTACFRTFSVDSSGNITGIDYKSFHGPAVWNNKVITLGDSTIRVALYRNAPSQTQLYLETWDISDVGIIAAASQDNWNFTVGSSPVMVRAIGDIWVIVCTIGTPLKALSLLISTPPPPSKLVTGLFVRGDEIQVVFSPSKMIRSLDFGDTWYEGEGIPADAKDIGFNVFDEEESFIGANGALSIIDTVSGEIFIYTTGATIIGQATRIDVDVDSRMAIIGTDQKLYKSLNLGRTVHLLKDSINVTDVAIAGTAIVPSGV